MNLEERARRWLKFVDGQDASEWRGAHVLDAILYIEDLLDLIEELREQNILLREHPRECELCGKRITPKEEEAFNGYCEECSFPECPETRENTSDKVRELGDVIGTHSLAWKFVGVMAGHEDVDSISDPEETERGMKFKLHMKDSSTVSVEITPDHHEVEV